MAYCREARIESANECYKYRLTVIRHLERRMISQGNNHLKEGVKTLRPTGIQGSEVRWGGGGGKGGSFTKNGDHRICLADEDRGTLLVPEEMFEANVRL